MRVGLVVGLAIVTAAGGCRRGSVPALRDTVAPVPPASRIYYDNGGGVQDSVRLVVRDEASLREAWGRATSRQEDPPPLPSVDFSRDMVLMVGAGRMTPEDRIRVDSAGVRQEPTADGRTREYMAVVVRTLVGCGRFPSDAYPLEIVRVQRFDGEVEFLERRERATDCG